MSLALHQHVVHEFRVPVFCIHAFEQRLVDDTRNRFSFGSLSCQVFTDVHQRFVTSHADTVMYRDKKIIAYIKPLPMFDPSMTMMVIMYQSMLFSFFATAYSLMGFSSNFSLPDTRSTATPLTIAYFTITAQTTTGFGDIHASTDFARLFVSVHVLLAWIPMLLIFA